jgi:hypothetical protein
MASHVIDSRTFEPRRNAFASGCRCCGAPVTWRGDQKLYCCRRHQRDAAQARHEGAPLNALPGHCHCGVELVQAPLGAYCSRRCRMRWQRETKPYAWFASRVKWPHDLSWLATKIGLEATDPRLPEIALTLAQADRLYVYIDRQGQVGAVGKPKPKRQHADKRKLGAAA